ncbi:sigma-70 family RNA polymerase sigma factor [Spirillospora sp. NPDC050679]
MNYANETDAALVRAFAAASAAERDGIMRELVRRHEGPVKRYCASRLGGDPDAAADAAQETFIVALRRLADLRDPAVLRTWLIGIARNLTAQQVRRDARLRLALTGDIERLEAPRAEQDAEFLRRATAAVDLVERVLPTLPPEHQRMFELVGRRGCKGEELARELGVSTERAFKRAHAHREYLRRALGATVLVLAGLGCEKLKAIVREAGPLEGVPSPELRLKAVNHIGACKACSRLRDRRMARFSPAVLPAFYLEDVRERFGLVSAETGLPVPPPARRDGERASDDGRTAPWGPVAAALAVAAILGVLVLLGARADRDPGYALAPAVRALPAAAPGSRAPGAVPQEKERRDATPTRRGTGEGAAPPAPSEKAPARSEPRRGTPDAEDRPPGHTPVAPPSDQPQEQAPADEGDGGEAEGPVAPPAEPGPGEPQVVMPAQPQAPPEEGKIHAVESQVQNGYAVPPPSPSPSP